MTDTDQLVVWLREAMDAAERSARATTPVPVPGEWAAVRDKHAEDTAPLALIQGRGDDEYDFMGDSYRSNLPVIAYAAEWQDEAEANLRFIAANGPAAVLRRIAADRKTLELHNQAHECVSYDWVSKDINTCMWVDADETCTTVRLLAEGYGWKEGQ